MRVKKVNIFKDIELENFNSIETTFFDISIFHLCPRGRILKKIVLSWRIRIILEGGGFRGGSDEKMRRMWLGLKLLWLAFLPSFHGA